MKTTLLLLTLSLAVPVFADPPPDVARLYRLKCGGCHGADGTGGIGPSLKAKLRHPAARLFDVIKNGIPGTDMPASGLPDLQVKKMVTYVLFLNKTKH